MIAKRNGFTLIELMIALGITTAVLGAIFGGIYQVINNTGKNSDHMSAVLQVQNAGNRIGSDIHMAQTIETVANLTSPDFLHLTWIEASTGNKYDILYTYQDMDTGSMKNLMRLESINDTDNATYLISKYIDPSADMTTCNVSADGIFTLLITASCGSGEDGTETRLYRVFPRPG